MFCFVSVKSLIYTCIYVGICLCQHAYSISAITWIPVISICQCVFSSTTIAKAVSPVVSLSVRSSVEASLSKNNIRKLKIAT